MKINKFFISTFLCLVVWATFLPNAQLGAAGTTFRQQKDTALKVFDAVVDISGQGDYTDVQQAIDHAPQHLTRPWRIFIKKGDYEGLIRIPENKPYIYLIGEDKDKTIISFKINCADPANTGDAGQQYSKLRYDQQDCAVVVVNAPDFYAQNISFVNAYGVTAQKGPQALAMKVTADRSAFFNCRFRSFQDTWMTSTKGLNDRTYANDCWIEGAVDYFYGGGNAFIDHCTLYNVRGGSVIVAPRHLEGTKWGYVFSHCIIDGNKAAADGRTKLGRPWHDAPMAVYLNTILKIPINPEGWTDMGPAAKLFAEYNTRDQNGRLVDLSKRRTWYKQSKGEGGRIIQGLQAVLTKKEAAAYTYTNVVEGKDRWDPRKFFEQLRAPEHLMLDKQDLKWKRLKEAGGYLVALNGQILGVTTHNFFKISGSAVGVWTVTGVKNNGSLGKSATLQGR
jgi:pectinesterase